MEKPNIDKKENVIIHKGLFYYIGRAIAFPFWLLYKILSWLWKRTNYIRKYLNGARIEHSRYKALNKSLFKKLEDEEVI